MTADTLQVHAQLKRDFVTVCDHYNFGAAYRKLIWRWIARHDDARNAYRAIAASLENEMTDTTTAAIAESMLARANALADSATHKVELLESILREVGAEHKIPRACRALEQDEVGAPCVYLEEAESAIRALAPDRPANNLEQRNSSTEAESQALAPEASDAGVAPGQSAIAPDRMAAGHGFRRRDRTEGSMTDRTDDLLARLDRMAKQPSQTMAELYEKAAAAIRDSQAKLESERKICATHAELRLAAEKKLSAAKDKSDAWFDEYNKERVRANTAESRLEAERKAREEAERKFNAADSYWTGAITRNAQRTEAAEQRLRDVEAATIEPVAWMTVDGKVFTQAHLALAHADGVTEVVPLSTSRFALAGVLKAHYLRAVECHHESKCDKPHCACSMVELGWHPSVEEAVAVWIAHVIRALAPERTVAHTDHPMRHWDRTCPACNPAQGRTVTAQERIETVTDARHSAILSNNAAEVATQVINANYSDTSLQQIVSASPLLPGLKLAADGIEDFLKECERVADNISENGSNLRERFGEEHEGRCRELCSMYLREFIINYRMKQRLAEISRLKGEGRGRETTR